MLWDFDGTVTAKNCVHHLLLVKQNTATNKFQKYIRTINCYLKVPLFWSFNKLNSNLFNTYFYKQINFNANTYDAIYEKEVASYFTFFCRDEVKAKINEYKQQGALQFLVSASPDFFIKKISKTLGLTDGFGSPVPLINGDFTGQKTPFFLDQNYKVQCLQEIIDSYNLDPKKLTIDAYGNSKNDIPMLQKSNNGYIVTPDGTLEKASKSHNWSELKTHASPSSKYSWHIKAFINFGFTFIQTYLKKYSGIYNIPSTGGAILIANHGSYLDHYFIGLIVAKKLKRKMHFLAKKEHFETKLASKLHKDLGAVPINRQNFGSEQLKTAIEIVNRGDLLILYPEGTRTLNGKQKPFKRGFLKIQEQTQAPIIPIGLKNTFELLPKGSKIPKPKAIVEVNVGKLSTAKEVKLLGDLPTQLAYFENKILSLQDENSTMYN